MCLPSWMTARIAFFCTKPASLILFVQLNPDCTRTLSFVTSTYIFSKNIWSFGQIQIAIWTNAVCNLDKYILQFGHIYFARISRISYPCCWASTLTALTPSILQSFTILLQSFTILFSHSQSFRRNPHRHCLGTTCCLLHNCNVGIKNKSAEVFNEVRECHR